MLPFGNNKFHSCPKTDCVLFLQWSVVLGSPDITHFAGIKIVVRVPRYAFQTHALPGGPLQPGTNEFHKVRTLTEVYKDLTHVLPELSLA